MSVLGILGTIHNEEMRKEFNYSLEKMAEIIEEFKPDIICGEIRPEDWQKYCDDKNYEGYLGPNEYRKLIIPLCEQKGIKLVPVDWFEDDLVNMDYLSGKSAAETKEIEKQFDFIMAEYMAIAKNSIIPFNSLDFNNIVEKKQDFQKNINSDVHNVYWTCRNQIMIERIKRTLDVSEGKRVLCTVGAEHTYLYHKILKETNWEIRYPIK